MAVLHSFLSDIFGTLSEASPFVILLFAFFWLYIHHRVSLYVPYVFLPTASWETHKRKIESYLSLRRDERTQERGSPMSVAHELLVDHPAEPQAAASSEKAAAASSPQRIQRDHSPKQLREYFVTSRANGTAFLHAVIICPLALAVIVATLTRAYEELGFPTMAPLGAPHEGPLGTPLDGPIGVPLINPVGGPLEGLSGGPLAPSRMQKGANGVAKRLLWDWGETDSFYNFHSSVLDLLAYLMAGYFVWDLVECIIHRDVHSRAFIVHGLLSLFAMVSYLVSPNGRMTGISAFMCLTELSTPLIHIRWFLLQTGAAGTRYFNIINASAAAVFLVYRLGIVPLVVLPHLVVEWLSGCPYTAKASMFRRVSFSVSCGLWVLLNAYWACRFARSISKSRTAVEPKED